MKYPIIDVLKLHHPGDTEKSAIRAWGGKKLNKIFNKLSTQACQRNNISYNKLAKILDVNKNSLRNWRGFNKYYLNGHPIPLWALDEILGLLNLNRTETHINIIKNIKELQCGRTAKKVKAATRLTPELAMLCGAHAADGSLYGLKNKGPITARWDIGDLESSNIAESRKWISDLFGINMPNMMKGKMSYTWTSMQIVPRYLIQIFDFPIGRKTETVREPKIFYMEDERVLTKFLNLTRRKLRLEFAKEVINFDGHSTMTGGIVSTELGCNSSHLRSSVQQIFQKSGVNFHVYDKHNKILTTSRKESEKIFELGVFRGKKREKLCKLLGSYRIHKAEKNP